MLSKTRGSTVIAVLAMALAAACAAKGKVVSEAKPEVARGCPPERAQNGEVRLVFLGDSGYGEGFSEWGTHGQDAIAKRLATLTLPPDLVFFLGDNIYWRGSADLYKTRFDDVYDPLIRDCKVHVALGNHDLKGCRAVEEYERWESCLQDLRTSLVADRKARFVRQGLAEAEAEKKAEAETAAESAGELAAKAILTQRGNCLPGDATAYEPVTPATPSACYAKEALSHAQFGFGTVSRGDPPAEERQRYYSILWPLPKLTPAGQAADPKAPEVRPLVNVVVLDSNTLDVGGSVLASSPDRSREDQLQLLWLRNAMSQWVPAPDDKHGVWKILAMHHPPFTPRSCACQIFGKCIGGHSDETGLQAQFKKTLEDLPGPDLMLTAHNHIYARSHPLDWSGEPVTDKPGVRYFVTGGGGGPVYDVRGTDPRFSKSFSTYHFLYFRLTAAHAFYWAIDAGGRVKDSGCFAKGSNVDFPLSPEFSYADSLPPRCGPPGASKEAAGAVSTPGGASPGHGDS